MGLRLTRRSGGGGASDAISDALATRAGIALKPWNYATTLFTDTAGTVAATQAGDIIAVAKCLDKGLQYQQTTLANRPILTRWPKSGKRNYFQRTDDFAVSYWARVNATPTVSGVSGPSGVTGATVYHLVPAAVLNIHFIRNLDNTLRASNAISVYAKKGAYKYLQITMQAVSNNVFNLDTGAVTSGIGASIVSIGDGWYRCTVTGTSATGVCEIGVARESDGVWGNWTPDGTSGIYISSPQVEPGTTATAYQKVTIAQDITEAGQADCWGLTFDGTNDGMATAATLDLSGSDKVGVFAGLYKTSDAGVKISIEHSATVNSNAGSFALLPNGGYGAAAGAYYEVVARGSLIASAASSASFAAPIHGINTLVNDIAGDSAILRNNGVQVASSVADQGTGNFGNYTNYLGARAGTSLYFNGICWGVAIVSTLDATTDAAIIAAIESQIADNTPGVTL